MLEFFTLPEVAESVSTKCPAGVSALNTVPVCSRKNIYTYIHGIWTCQKMQNTVPLGNGQAMCKSVRISALSFSKLIKANGKPLTSSSPWTFMAQGSHYQCLVCSSLMAIARPSWSWQVLHFLKTWFLSFHWRKWSNNSKNITVFVRKFDPSFWMTYVCIPRASPLTTSKLTKTWSTSLPRSSICVPTMSILLLQSSIFTRQWVRNLLFVTLWNVTHPLNPFHFVLLRFSQQDCWQAEARAPWADTLL